MSEWPREPNDPQLTDFTDWLIDSAHLKAGTHSIAALWDRYLHESSEVPVRTHQPEPKEHEQQAML